MPYEPSLYNNVPRRRDNRNGVTIALVVILGLCLVCGAIGGIGGIIAIRGVAEALPTIQADIAATLTATAAPPRAASNRSLPPVEANTTPRPTVTSAPTVTPRPTATATPVRPTATPLPKPEVAVAQLGYFRDTWDDLWFIGELVNSGAMEAGDFRLSIALLGAEGQVLASAKLERSELGVAALKPGQKTVWRLKVPDAPRQWQSERIEATTGPVIVSRNQSPYLELRAEGVQFTPGEKPFNRTIARGQLVNSGIAAVREGRARLAIYDDTGKLIRVLEGTPKFAEIAPGAAAPFTCEFSDLEQPPARYTLYLTSLR